MPRPPPFFSPPLTYPPVDGTHTYSDPLFLAEPQRGEGSSAPPAANATSPAVSELVPACHLPCGAPQVGHPGFPAPQLAAPPAKLPSGRTADPPSPWTRVAGHSIAGASPSAPIPSFAQVVSQEIGLPKFNMKIHAPAFSDSGEPATFFSSDEVYQSCQALRFAIIARTPRGRPAYDVMRYHLAQRFKFNQHFVISSLDSRHLLLRF